MVPHFFRKEAIPEITNEDLKKSIDFVSQAKSKEEALQRAYKIITDRFEGHRFHTYIRLHKAFELDPNVLWKRTGFMHCTHQNYLLRVLLVKSGWFDESALSIGHSLVWYISPHQYLRVNLNGKALAVDPWNSRFGAKLGTYATGFGFKEL